MSHVLDSNFEKVTAVVITQKTVFVLGAGAHCSYGFPSGKALKREVVTTLRESIESHSESSLLLMPSALGIQTEEVQNHRVSAFATALEKSGQGSIDAFLNSNRHQVGFETIGKAGIAQVLLRHEETASDQADDWLGYIFEIMCDGISTPEDFVSQNHIAFVTFNYDRYLEFWLQEKLQHSFGIDRTASLDLLSRIEIHHVYGSLGSIQNIHNVSGKTWMQASRGIRTIFDAERCEDEIDKSKTLLRLAKIVCLLGYGFHQENVALLGLVDCLSRTDVLVASSRFELMDSDWQRLTRPLAAASIQVQGAHCSYKCLTALRHLPVF